MRSFVLWVLVFVALLRAGDCDRRLLQESGGLEVRDIPAQTNSAGVEGSVGKVGETAKGKGGGKNKEKANKIKGGHSEEEEHAHEEEEHGMELGGGDEAVHNESHIHHDEEHEVNEHEGGGHVDGPFVLGQEGLNGFEGHEGHEEHEEHEDHDHINHEEHGHMHSVDETPQEHIIMTWGAEGKLIQEEIGYIFKSLSDNTKKDGHDGHGHDHGHDEHRNVITPEDVIAEHGIDGALDEDGLVNACPMLLSCQLDDECTLSSEVEDDDDDDNSSQLALKIIAAAVFFVEVIVGGMVPLIVGHFEKLTTWLSLLNSFSGGIFMGAGFIHMLPEVQEAQLRVQGLDGYPLGAVMVVAGFLLLFFIEHIIFNAHDRIFGPVEPTPLSSQNPIKAVNELARETKRGPKTFRQILGPIRGPVILLLAISVHSLFEALALGLETDQNGILLLFATVGSHKGVAAMALSARFVREEATMNQVIMFLGAFACVAPLGILSGIWVSGVPDLVLLILNGLSAGTFIYIGAYEVISDEFGQHGKERKDKYLVHKYVAVVFGVFLMSILQLIPHEH